MVIGVTGPSGSGKGVLCLYLQKLGCGVIDCDRIAHRILRRSAPCINELIGEFGAENICAGGWQIDRAALARVAFSDPEKTRRLNEITHPYILREIDARLAELEKAGTPAVIDAPLLTADGLDARCDAIVVVTAPREVRIRRIRKRDGISAEQAEARLAARPETEPTGEKVTVLVNDGDPNDIGLFALALLERLNVQPDSRAALAIRFPMTAPGRRPQYIVDYQQEKEQSI